LDLLYAAGADVVLSAHDHIYERFAPQRPDGTADAATGIREFVVGTGGANHTSIPGAIAPNSETRNATTFGVLLLTLHSGGYDWSFSPEASSGNFTDTGSGQCHAGNDLAAPSTPTNLTGNAFSKTQVDLAWGASTDNVGVAGYTVYRNGSKLATVGAGTLSYRDETAVPATDYTYTVDAFDAAGNHSPQSNSVAIKTPGPSSTTFVPVADTYVDSKKTKNNFGTDKTFSTSVSPPSDQSAYVRFDVRGLAVNVTSAKLRVLPVRGDNAKGFDLHTVADNTWGETTTTFVNKPAMGSVIGSTGAFKAGVWQEIDVTSLIKGDGVISFGITSTSSKATDYASRESGVTAPELVVTSEPEKVAPSVPTLTSATAASPFAADLSWTASTDNVGVAGYTIYRNGNLVATVGSSTLSYRDSGLSPGTAYSYTVDAFDDARNRSAPSNAISVTTPSLTTLAYTPVADTYVDAGNPAATTFGTANVLRTDATPDVHSYVKFDLSGLGATITSAKLRVYANSSNPIGYDVQAVADNSWSESGTTYNNQPALGNVVGSSGPLTAGTWTEVDVTPLVTGNGQLSVALTSTSGTAASYASRETGANAPQLVITTDADTAAPSAPTLQSANAVSSTQVNLAWSAASDNRGVTGYTIYRDSAQIATVDGNTLSYSDRGLAAGTSYTYTVDAVDRAGNHSTQSNAITATTPAIVPTTTSTFTSVADTYVDAANPASSFGLSTSLRTDASPDVHSYVRFDLSGLGSTIVSAKLRVLANSNNSLGYQVRPVADNTWGETTTSYGNQPAYGSVVASSGGVVAATLCRALI
jgi:chitodextrinase